ncbi:MAG: DUF4358 domain-containing protein [Clostridiales bacterium]|nr:DUF4358 domain-containing protein [Clostridiales bacterium]
MDNEISKKQFIIISIVVIVITLVVIVSIVNSKNNNEVIDPENTTPITNNDNNVTNPDEVEVIIGEDNEQTGTVVEPEVDNELEIDEEETDIDISGTSENLSNLQSRIEVTTNNKNENILPEMITLSDEEIEGIIGIDISLLEDYVVRVASGKFDVDMYIIVKPSEENKDEVKTQINNFIKTYTNSWSKLSAPQYQLLENIKSVERKGYLIYLVSTDNETLMSVVREFIK